MKRPVVLLLAAAALSAFSACSKVEDGGGLREISFRPASYSAALSKAGPADYRAGYSDVPFGVYAWYKGLNPADNSAFMVNQKVSYSPAAATWAPEGSTYYWPKSGALDFICYSPYSDSPAPVVTESGISYPSWDVSAAPATDLLYGDKAVGLSDNANEYYSSGVPVLFRHALARVAFRIRLSYSEVEVSPTDRTRWEVDVKDMYLSGISSDGSLDLTLGADGLWQKPSSDVWTEAGGTCAPVVPVSSLLTFDSTEPQEAGEPFLVLPQLLDKGQTVNFTLDIRTWRDTGSGYVPAISETGVNVSGSLATAALDRWGINQYIIYTFVLSPSKGGSLPTEISFDPAVAGWDTVETAIEIKL